jgi:hypothetical protein
VLLEFALPGPMSFLWLLPAVGFVAADLALSTWISPLVGVAIIATVWSAAVWVAANHSNVEAVLQWPYRSAYVALAAVSIAVFALRARHVRGAHLRRST